MKNKYYLVTPIVLFAVFVTFLNGLSFGEQIVYCGDGTHSGECSGNKPYYCDNGILIENVVECGCSEILENKEGICFSEYFTDEINASFKYILRGKENYIDLVLYKGVEEYVSNLPRIITHGVDEEVVLSDFKLKNINDEIQREALVPLVVAIQNKAKSKEEQARIAISLVQNIPYKKTDKLINLSINQQVESSRYLYDVLYENEGVCGEKSDLLSFLLKELGYGTVIFHYSYENHEAVGVRCPAEYSLGDTGYCFIESTGPSIISYSKGTYVNGYTLSSIPELILVSRGNSLSDKMYEYEDADELETINRIIASTHKINVFMKSKLEDFEEKYGMNLVAD